MQVFVHRNNEQLGPFTEAEVRAQLAAGTISPNDHVWWEGQASWVPIASSPLMAPISASTPAATLPGSQVERTSGTAMASLIVGIVSIVSCGFLAIPTVILGHMGLSATKKPFVHGRGLAIAGLILGYVQLVIAAVVFFFFSASVLALIGLGNAVQKSVDQQMQSLTNNADQNPTPPDQTTNAPDMNTPAPATTPDQTTNSSPATTNAPDSSTNSAPSTNSPDSSTNAAPTGQ